ncbi:MAG TPA: ABC transporter ATP-binding protein [Actinomycetota bacterium]|nr:ABC transporter ATP-binding protein [Actinomycetota bacterium]
MSTVDSWRGVASETAEEVTGGMAGFLRRRSRRLLGSLLRPHLRGFAMGGVLVTLNAAAILAGPLLVKLGIDSGIEPFVAGAPRRGQPLTILFLVVAAYAVMQILDAVTLRGFQRVTGRTGENVLYDLRTRVHDHFQRLSVSFYERYTSGRIIARLTSDIDALSELLYTGMIALPVAILQLVGIAVILFFLDPPLAAVTLSVFPLVFLLTRWFRRESERVYRKVREAVALVIIHFTESLGGIRAVHAYRREPRNQEIFEDVNGRYRDANMESIRVSSLYGPGVQVLGDLAVTACLVYGGYRVLGHDIPIGTLVAFVLYMRQFFQPMQELSQVYNVFQAASASLEKLSGVLEEEPSVAEPDPASAVSRQHWGGRITFEDVTFAYREKPVLEHLSFEVPAGQTVALVGPTGAGKSTIAKLVSRFYDPTRGRVCIDGVDLRCLSDADLRRTIVLVTQEGFLFSGTVAENIAFGRPDATREDIERAARVVGAYGFISELPEGFDTDVRKRGGRLSAGQRQLVALARAFLADPQVIIFDEATSSIDMPSERLIQEALEVVLRDRTAFIIAHRLATVEIADRVLVIEDGGVVEDGSPGDLVLQPGRWAALSQAWEDSLA